jgi:small subunit ribosomal protein S8
MAMVDPIADLLTRIRNGNAAGFPFVEVPASRMKGEVVRVLKREGYIRNFSMRKQETFRVIKIYLKYTDTGDKAFAHLQQVSRPGRRVYVGKKELPVVAGGVGMAIVSTSHGLMTSKQARAKGVGGEVICYVW